MFDRLRKRVEGGREFGAVPDPGAARWIEGETSEQEALKRAEIVRHVQLPSSSLVALVRWEKRAFAALAFGRNEPSRRATSSWFVEVSENVGLFVLLACQPLLHVVADEFEIVEHAFGASGPVPRQSVRRLFARTHFLEFASAHASKRDAEVWSISEAAMARELALMSPPEWMATIQEDFVTLLEGDVARYGGNALLAAAYAHEPHHAFLQLYRAFEGLFRVALIEAFLTKIGQPDEVSRRLVSDAIDAELGWRLREIDAVMKILRVLPGKTVTDVAKLMGSDPTVESVGKMFYTTRNRIAHGSMFYEPPTVSVGMLSACIELLRSGFSAIRVPDSWIPA